MKKFIEAIYDLESNSTLVRNPENPEIWVNVNHHKDVADGVQKQTTCECVTETHEVCSGVHVGPPPDYIQTPFGCKTVTSKICNCK